ncbi:Protein of unknown function [Gryllus bimaculatus]|nr:Protein of unknown function [Gryllus bimaculatus]
MDDAVTHDPRHRPSRRASESRHTPRFRPNSRCTRTAADNANITETGDLKHKRNRSKHNIELEGRNLTLSGYLHTQHRKCIREKQGEKGHWENYSLVESETKENTHQDETAMLLKYAAVPSVFDFPVHLGKETSLRRHLISGRTSTTSGHRCYPPHTDQKALIGGSSRQGSGPSRCRRHQRPPSPPFAKSSKHSPSHRSTETIQPPHHLHLLRQANTHPHIGLLRQASHPITSICYVKQTPILTSKVVIDDNIADLWQNDTEYHGGVQILIKPRAPTLGPLQNSFKCKGNHEKNQDRKRYTKEGETVEKNLKKIPKECTDSSWLLRSGNRLRAHSIVGSAGCGLDEVAGVEDEEEEEEEEEEKEEEEQEEEEGGGGRREEEEEAGGGGRRGRGRAEVNAVGGRSRNWIGADAGGRCEVEHWELGDGGGREGWELGGGAGLGWQH